MTGRFGPVAFSTAGKGQFKPSRWMIRPPRPDCGSRLRQGVDLFQSALRKGKRQPPRDGVKFWKPFDTIRPSLGRARPILRITSELGGKAPAGRVVGPTLAQGGAGFCGVGSATQFMQDLGKA